MDRQMHVRMSAEDLKSYQRVAEKLGLTLSQLVRLSLEAYSKKDSINPCKNQES